MTPIETRRHLVLVLPDFIVVDLAGLDRLRLILRPGLHGAIKIPLAVLLHGRVVDPIVLNVDMETGPIGVLGPRLG
jgi:hypothetical protein